MDTTYRAVIVDDERRARKALATLLGDYPAFEICGEAANADEGIRLITETKPDIIFLDIQMPRKSGFDMLQELDTDAAVIFITAFDQYAIRAFEVNALDYLLKPVLPERLEQTLRRLTQTTPPAAATEQFLPDDSVSIQDGRKIIFRKISDLLAVQSDGDYTQLHFNDRVYLANQTMNEWEERLPGSLFKRVDRSLIINRQKISELQIRNRDRAVLHLMQSKQTFELGRTALTRVKQLIADSS